MNFLLNLQDFGKTISNGIKCLIVGKPNVDDGTLVHAAGPAFQTSTLLHHQDIKIKDVTIEYNNVVVKMYEGKMISAPGISSGWIACKLLG